MYLTRKQTILNVYSCLLLVGLYIAALGFCGKILVAGGMQGWLLSEVGRSFPYPTEPMPAGSRVNPPLAKAEPISDSDFGITWLRNEKGTAQEQIAAGE